MNGKFLLKVRVYNLEKNSNKISFYSLRGFVIFTLLFGIVIYSFPSNPAYAQSTTTPNLRNLSFSQSSLPMQTPSPSVQEPMTNSSVGTWKTMMGHAQFLGTVKLKDLPLLKIPYKRYIGPDHPEFSPEMIKAIKQHFQPMISKIPKAIVISPKIFSKGNMVVKGDPTYVLNGMSGLDVSAGPGGGTFDPADVSVAAGNNLVIETDNANIGVWDESGNVISPEASILGMFQNAVPPINPNDNVSDARVIFDTTSSSFFVSAVDFNTDTVYFAVSTNSSPSPLASDWDTYSFTNTVCPDQAKIGTSADKLLFSYNSYNVDSSGCGQTFIGTGEVVIDKAAVISGNPSPALEYTQVLNIFTFNLLPVSTNKSDMYLIEKIPQTPLVRLFYVYGTPQNNNAVISTVPRYYVPAEPIQGFDYPVKGVQPGSTLIDTTEGRGLTAAWSPTSQISGHGQIWIGWNEGCYPNGDPNRENCIHLAQVDPDVQAPCIPPLQCGTNQDLVLGIPSTSVYYPALSLDSSNDLSFIFGLSSSSIFPSLAAAGQTAGQIGTLSPIVTIVPGSGSYSSTCNSQNTPRYGDYFGASPDPNNPSSIWVGGAFVTSMSTPCTTTFLSQIQTSLTPPPLPSLASISCSADYGTQPGDHIAAGDSTTITCTITPQHSFTGTVTLTKVESILNPLELDTTSVNLASCSQPCTPQTATVHLTATPYTPRSYYVALNGVAELSDLSGATRVYSNVVPINVASSQVGMAAAPQPTSNPPLFHYSNSWDSYSATGTGWNSFQNENVKFSNPTGIATDSSGNVYVADNGNNNIVEFDQNGKFIKYWNSYDDHGASIQIQRPNGLAIDSSGNIFFASQQGGLFGTSNCVAIIDNNQLTNNQNSLGNIFTNNQNQKELNRCVDAPNGIALDSQDNIYTAGNARMNIAEYNAQGDEIAVGTNPYYGQDQSTNADSHTGIAVDSSGIIYNDDLGSIEKGNYVADSYCNLSNPLSQKIVTYTDGLCVYPYGNGKWAPFHLASATSIPHSYSGLAVDSNDDYVYVVDSLNDKILIFHTNGDFITSFGSAGSLPGQFNKPTGITVDKSGSVYVTDTGNNRVEKFSLSHGPCQSCIGTNSISSLALAGKITNSSSASLAIPSWIKNTAGWWSQGQVSDAEFIKSLQYLIDNKIIIVPKTTSTVTAGQTTNVPPWVKNTAGMWATGKISDQQFLSSVQYLIGKGIIKTGAVST